MKKTIAVALLVFLALYTSGCGRHHGGITSTGSEPPPSSSWQSSAESISQSDSIPPAPESPAPESSVTVSIANLSNSIPAFEMKETDTACGWILTEIEPYDMPSETMFYGVLTFTGEVEVKGTITHVNAIYDGFDFVPDKASREKILIPDGRECLDFFVRIANDTDTSIAQSLSGLAVGESGAYTVTITQYRLPYVPMMAVNSAVLSSLEKLDG